MSFRRADKQVVVIPDPMSPTHNPEKKAKITLSEGLTVFFCLTVSLASLMALVIYVGFFWYLEQQRQIKDYLTLVVATGASRDLVAGVSATHLIHVNSRLSSLSSQDQVCSDGDAYPFAAVGAVGFIENKRVRVCGGVDSRNTTLKACYSLEDRSWRPSAAGGLTTPRAHAAMIWSSRHGYWVTGGEGADGVPLASTEVSERPGRKFKLGPKLPIGISRHCLIRIGESPIHIKFLLVGGRTTKSEHSTQVWTLSLGLNDSDDPPWMALRALGTGRHSHSCFMHDGMVFVAGGAVAGASEDPHGGTTQVESYSVADNKWTAYKPLPFGPLVGARVVSLGSDAVPTLVGGSRTQKHVIQLTPDGEWTLNEDVEVKEEVFYPVALTARPEWVCSG